MITQTIANPQNGIKVKPVATSKLAQLDMDNIPFGRMFTDYMLKADYQDGEWGAAEIVPYGKLEFTPAISALNYGQSVFEGMKAFKNPDGRPQFFRIEDNFKRINQSAERLSMPPILRSTFIDGIKKLVEMEKAWVPSVEQGTLYIRPLYFATDEMIGVHNSSKYTFVAFCCPVGMYYSEPVKLLATKDFIRAASGGTGSAKAAGNYAAAMLPDRLAKEQGYNNVLWLDAREHQYIEECGTMNVFFVIDDTVITPRLTGTILPGITRESVIHLLKDNGYKVEERRVSIYEIEAAYNAGTLKEAFGTGTAAGIAHIELIGFGGKKMIMQPVVDRKVGPWLLKTINGIKHGTMDDPYNWIDVV